MPQGVDYFSRPLYAILSDFLVDPQLCMAVIADQDARYLGPSQSISPAQQGNHAICWVTSPDWLQWTGTGSTRPSLDALASSYLPMIFVTLQG